MVGIHSTWENFVDSYKLCLVGRAISKEESDAVLNFIRLKLFDMLSDIKTEIRCLQNPYITEKMRSNRIDDLIHKIDVLIKPMEDK